jgi:hypothetical protein
VTTVRKVRRYRLSRDSGERGLSVFSHALELIGFLSGESNGNDDTGAPTALDLDHLISQLDVVRSHGFVHSQVPRFPTMRLLGN